MPNWSLTLQKSNRTLFSLLYKTEVVYSVEKHLWKYRNYFFKGTVFKDFSINDTEILCDHLTNVTFERVACGCRAEVAGKR